MRSDNVLIRRTSQLQIKIAVSNTAYQLFTKLLDAGTSAKIQSTKRNAARLAWPRKKLGYGKNDCILDDQHRDESVSAMTMLTAHLLETAQELLINESLVNQRSAKVQSRLQRKLEEHGENNVRYGRVGLNLEGHKASCNSNFS